MAIEQFCFTAVVIGLGLYLQKILGYCALHSSLIFLALSLMTGLISPFGGVLVSRFGFKNLAQLGQLILALGVLWIILLGINPNLIALILALVTTGVGMGIALTALQTGILTTVNENEVSSASSIFIMLALIGNATGVLITSMLYESSSQHWLVQKLTLTGHTVTPSLIQNLQQAITQIGSTQTALQIFPQDIQAFLHTNLVYGLHVGFDTAMGCAASGIVISLIFFRWMLRGYRNAKP